MKKSPVFQQAIRESIFKYGAVKHPLRIAAATHHQTAKA